MSPRTDDGTAAAIEARSLRVVRGRVEVLRGIDLDVAPGHVTGLIGPSGCGKTTLIRTVAGSQRITSGSCRVLGQPAGAPGLRRQVGYAAQSLAVYQDLTVAENVRYFASVLQAPRTDVDRVIGQVDLGGSRNKVVGRLSGGQRSRVSLAVALLGSPQLLLLDEPTVGLDPVLREQLWTQFTSLAQQGISLLVSSHVMDEAVRCDGLILMREGAVLAQGSPADLLSRTGSGTLEAAFLSLVRQGSA